MENRYDTIQKRQKKQYAPLFIQLFNSQSKYKSMSLEAKAFYALLNNRNNLSELNGWIDEKGRIFFIYTIEELQDMANCSKPKAIKLMQELRDYNLLISKKQGRGKPSKHYLLELEFEKEVYENVKNEERKILKKALNNIDEPKESTEIIKKDIEPKKEVQKENKSIANDEIIKYKENKKIEEEEKNNRIQEVLENTSFTEREAERLLITACYDVNIILNAYDDLLARASNPEQEPIRNVMSYLRKMIREELKNNKYN